jgi:hypothetical protein
VSRLQHEWAAEFGHQLAGVDCRRQDAEWGNREVETGAESPLGALVLRQPHRLRGRPQAGARGDQGIETRRGDQFVVESDDVAGACERQERRRIAGGADGAITAPPSWDRSARIRTLNPSGIAAW